MTIHQFKWATAFNCMLHTRYLIHNGNPVTISDIHHLTVGNNIQICNSFSTFPASFGIPELGYIFSIISIGVGRPGMRFRGVFCTGAAATIEESEMARMVVSFILAVDVNVS